MKLTNGYTQSSTYQASKIASAVSWPPKNGTIKQNDVFFGSNTKPPKLTSEEWKKLSFFDKVSYNCKVAQRSKLVLITCAPICLVSLIIGIMTLPLGLILIPGSILGPALIYEPIIKAMFGKQHQ